MTSSAFFLMFLCFLFGGLSMTVYVECDDNSFWEWTVLVVSICLLFIMDYTLTDHFIQMEFAP